MPAKQQFPDPDHAVNQDGSGPNARRALHHGEAIGTDVLQGRNKKRNDEARRRAAKRDFDRKNDEMLNNQ